MRNTWFGEYPLPLNCSRYILMGKKKMQERERGGKKERGETGCWGKRGAEEVKRERRRARGEEGEFTKAAQEGTHYDIKQDLISESDLMRWLSWPINQAGFWPCCNMAHLSPLCTKASLDAELLTALKALQKQHQAKKKREKRHITSRLSSLRVFPMLTHPFACPSALVVHRVNWTP